MFPIETFRVTLDKVVAILVEHQIRYHLTGGITSIAYGEPRMTQGIDIVVDNPSLSRHIGSFIQSLSDSGFLFDDASVRRAVENRTMFQLFDSVEALKLDLYPRELVPGELQRSGLLEVFDGIQLPVVALVDAAISKLIWINKGSHKSRRDLRQIHRRASGQDPLEIGTMAQSLHLSELLHTVLEESDEILD